MTDAELQGLAAQALNMAKRDIEQGDFNFLLASYFDFEGLRRMDKVEALIIQKLGPDWLNHGRTKDAGFNAMRACVSCLPPSAIVFVTAANCYVSTAKFLKLSPAKREKIIKAGHDRHMQGVGEGYFTLTDCLIATVQTPERVCVYQQKYDSERRADGPPESKFWPQATFDGRLKMYGTPKYDSV